MSRVEKIHAALLAAFPDARVTVQDDSHLHAGHAGAASGRGHFRVCIVSAAFTGLPPIARHRAVYAAVDALMQTDIHALSIDTQTPH